MARERIGLVAGGGRLPLLISEKSAELEVDLFTVGFQSETDPAIVGKCTELKWLKLGQLSRLIDFFHKNNVRKVMFAGTINKPRALNIRPDFRAARLIFSIKKKGDDALLRAVAGELEKEKLQVRSCLDMIPGLKAPHGQLTSRGPGKEEQEDIDYGRAILKSIGELDIGQCVVVCKQMVAAVEALEGTDAAIKRGGELTGNKGATVVKAAKPGQDLRFDQPAIGPETIRAMQKARATCLAFCAATCIFFEFEKSIKLADEYNLCVVGLPGV